MCFSCGKYEKEMKKKWQTKFLSLFFCCFCKFAIFHVECCVFSLHLNSYFDVSNDMCWWLLNFLRENKIEICIQFNLSSFCALHTRWRFQCKSFFFSAFIFRFGILKSVAVCKKKKELKKNEKWHACALIMCLIEPLIPSNTIQIYISYEKLGTR